MASGRPSFAKFGIKKRAAYLQLLREGNHRCTSARGVGVSPELVRLYRKRHKGFGAEEEQAEMEACGLVEDALFQAALGGNVTACQVWLYNRTNGRWQDKRNIDMSVDARTRVQVVEEIEDAPGHHQDDQAASGASEVPPE